ncbi:MAG: hypothetical protein A2Z66_14650 [Chloroflexi bacterium RBG_13_66_10]|nr:MAG: hypothetical protein A2Z66_14650 [Chloroflexi bacterium RBG_13_66_10]
MHKLMLLFRHPASIEGFETAWSHSFVPAAEQMPGIRRVTVSRPLESLSGPSDLYLVHEFFFDNLPLAREAMTSPAGQAAGRALMSFAAENVSLCFAEHLEEDRPAA